jgi:hypothetical protein
MAPGGGGTGSNRGGRVPSIGAVLPRASWPHLYQSAEGIFVTVNRSYKLVPAPIRRIPNEWFGRCHIHFKESCVSDTILEKPLGRSTIIDKSSQTGWAGDCLPLACCGSSVVGVGGTQCLLVRACLINGIDLRVSGCDLEHPFGVCGACGDVELNGAVLAGSGTITSFTIAGESHTHSGGGCEQDKVEAVRSLGFTEFVEKNGETRAREWEGDAHSLLRSQMKADPMGHIRSCLQPPRRRRRWSARTSCGGVRFGGGPRSSCSGSSSPRPPPSSSDRSSLRR